MATTRHLSGRWLTARHRASATWAAGRAFIDALRLPARGAHSRPLRPMGGEGDRFLIGVNLPWLSYGGDFGASAWQPTGGVAQPESRARLREVLGWLAGAGIGGVRWFMLCDGRAGIRFADNDAVVGLDDRIFADVDAAVEEAERARVPIIFALVDFHWFARGRRLGGVQLGGRTRLIATYDARDRLLDTVFAPLLERYGQHPAILAWDVINEPEWAIRGAGSRDRGAGIGRSAMRAFIGRTVQLIHDATVHPATVGLASTRGLPLVRGLGIDLYQVHWYDDLDAGAALDRDVSTLRLDGPLLLGEFPTRGSARSPGHIIESARSHGYRGALAWSALSNDKMSGHAEFIADLTRERSGLLLRQAGTLA